MLSRPKKDGLADQSIKSEEILKSVIKNHDIRDQIRAQTLTFAVLSQAMGVVTYGKENETGPFSRIAFQKL